MNWTVVSVAAQTSLLVYFQIHEWLHLPRWNDDLPGHPQARLDIVLGVVQSGLIVGTALETVPAMAVGVGVYAAWLALQVVGWWIPYVRGASDGHMSFYEAHWARTWKFLPPIGDHPIPNAAHVGLQALVLASLATTMVALIDAV
ncbi:MAG: hypothetical protein EPO22_06645 [Dehalococcoidia bacterium]|nr:MAG: hypothetical protein EPO22_06645 [Dehalococcoidia bacterium]